MDFYAAAAAVAVVAAAIAGSGSVSAAFSSVEASGPSEGSPKREMM